jgi:hypothetical protein
MQWEWRLCVFLTSSVHWYIYVLYSSICCLQNSSQETSWGSDV